MVYAVSDLHGYSPAAFHTMLKSAGFTDADYLFILGDVIDRGEHGARFLSWLIRQPNMQLILGNHEAMLLDCAFLFEEVNDASLDALSMLDIRRMQHWMKNGGKPTLEGLKQILKQDPQHFAGIWEYLEEAPLYETLTVGGRDYILVHSGLGNFRPNRPLSDYALEELLWERPALDTVYYPDKTVVFGHTPTLFYGEAYRGRAVKGRGWICIDAGCAVGCEPVLLRLDDCAFFYGGSWHAEP